MENQPTKPSRKRRWRIVQILLSVGIAVGIFWGILPKIASYGEVWEALQEMTWLELLTLLAITGFNVWTYWPQMAAALPGLRIREAAITNQATTAVSNTVPAGGLVALGLTYGMLRSWGHSDSSISLMITTTGAWNLFSKLFMPVIALALLLLTGQATGSLLLASAVGLGVLLILGSLGALALWKENLARAIFGGVGHSWSRVRRLFGRPAVQWEDAGSRFRSQTIGLVKRRWFDLTWTTLLSHFALFLVLLLALRHVGISEQEVSAVQVFALFAFVRLLSAIPLTPGGVGIVELGYVGALILAARGRTLVPPSREVFEAQATAATLVFRSLTYGIQIPMGAACYLLWLRIKNKRIASRPTNALDDNAPAPDSG